MLYFPDPSSHDDMKRETEPIFSVYAENALSLTLSLENVFSNIASGSGLSRVENNSAANENIGSNIEHGNASESSSDDDDCVMIGENIPLPLRSTAEGLIKQQDDPISNDIPYITSVCYIFV